MAGRDNNPIGFGTFKVYVAEQLTNLVIAKLSTIFEFEPALQEEAKGNGLIFVNQLVDSGTITDTDISRLLKALDQLHLGGLQLKVQREFKRCMEVAPQVENDAAPIEPAPEEKDASPTTEGELSIR